MTAVPVAPQPWSWRRRLGLIALVFIVQLALIFWLGSTTPVRPRPPEGGFILRFAGKASAEMRALNNPTLFTLAHPQPLTEPARPRIAPPELQSFEWSAPTNRLALTLDQPGTVFNRLVETGDANRFSISIEPSAAPTLPTLVPQMPPPAGSTLQLEGSLAQRGLLSPLELRPQTNQDILTNTIVQMGVDADGLPVSVVLLSSSGSGAADQYGLAQAWAARFRPAEGGAAGTGLSPSAETSWGRMVFRWHTVPAPAPAPPSLSP